MKVQFDQTIKFIEGITKQTVSSRSAAGRLIEEVTELALECGLSIGEIFSHVADAAHNEAKKDGCYPSQIKSDFKNKDNIAEEAADCFIMLCLIWKSVGVKDPCEPFNKKLALNLKRKFKVNKDGSFYAIKEENNDL